MPFHAECHGGLLPCRLCDPQPQFVVRDPLQRGRKRRHIIGLGQKSGIPLSGEAPVPLPATSGISPGQKVRLALRTEDFSLAGGPDCAISGTVLIRSYLGQRTRLRLRHAAGSEFDVDLPSAPGLPGEADVAHLGFLPGRTRLFAADDGRRLV
jgi:hypothetical protein